MTVGTVALGIILCGLGAITAVGVWMGRRYGFRPWALSLDDSAEGLAGRAFTFAATLLVAALAAGALSADAAGALGVVPILAGPALARAGVGLIVLGIALVIAAQCSMRQSWRIGIPRGETPVLVRTGPFVFSRNPIFLGMLATAGGVVLVLPTAVTLAAFAVAVLAAGVQVRMEEEFLTARLGEDYLQYRASVRRWL